MSIRIDIITTARKYLNTPFHPAGRLIGVGVDCAGLGICVAKELNIKYIDVQGYTQMPARKLFLKTVEEQLDKIDFKDIQIGDFLLFSFLSSRDAHHIAIVTEIGNRIKIIHAFNQAGKVVEHDLDEYWKNKMVGAYKFRGIE